MSIKILPEIFVLPKMLKVPGSSDISRYIDLFLKKVLNVNYNCFIVISKEIISMDYSQIMPVVFFVVFVRKPRS